MDSDTESQPIKAESEAVSRVYRSKSLVATSPDPSRGYYPKGYSGARTGATVPGTVTTPAPSISAEEIRANSVTTNSVTTSGTTASGGAAIAPATTITGR